LLIFYNSRQSHEPEPRRQLGTTTGLLIAPRSNGSECVSGGFRKSVPARARALGCSVSCEPSLRTVAAKIPRKNCGQRLGPRKAARRQP
jgi:hypothetical protein